MMMFPPILPDKLPAERIAIYMGLGPVIGTDSIVGVPNFFCDPAGLVFEGMGAIDSSKTAAAFVSGGDLGTTYVVSALCVLTSGETVQPTVALPVVEPAAEISDRRPQLL